MKSDYCYFDYARVKGLLSDGLPVWSLCLFDAQSNLRYLLYVACEKPTSLHVTNFLVKAFRECGIPAGLYVDADELIRSPRLQAFARMIRHGFAMQGDLGDFQLEQVPTAQPRSIGSP